MDPSFTHKLYLNKPRCLHVERYLIYDKVATTICGPCFFRDGVMDEVPTRITMREGSGLFGGPQFDPILITHLMTSVGLVPPDPGQSLRDFRLQRLRRSQPSPKLFPFTTALWELMGVQPPLARVLVKFCQGFNEIEIAQELDLSVYNVVDRMAKSVHVGKKFLRV